MVKGPLSEADKPIRCSMRLPSLWVLAALAIGLESCSPEQTGYTEQERADGLTLSPCYRGATRKAPGISHPKSDAQICVGASLRCCNLTHSVDSSCARRRTTVGKTSAKSAVFKKT